MAGSRSPASYANNDGECPIFRLEYHFVKAKNEKKSDNLLLPVLLPEERGQRKAQEAVPENEQSNEIQKQSSQTTHCIPSNSTSNGATASSSGVCERPSTQFPTRDPATILTLEQRENLGCLLVEAVCANETEEVRRLLDAGADVNFCNDFSVPLLDAAGGANTAIVSLLLERGADVNATTRRGENALHFAAVNDTTGKCLSLLIDAGGDLECANIKGDTPMHFAASVQNEVSVRTLLSAGASKTVRNREGQTPFSFAVDEPIKNLLRP